MKRKIFAIGGAVLALVVIASIVLGYRSWDSSERYVSTENAQISGDVVQVAPLAGGRVSAINADVGDAVKQGQSLASIDVAVAGSASSAQGLATTELLSPINGVVVARRMSAGSAVTALQPMFMVVDLGKLWVTANVDEAKIGRIKIGQPVDVHVDTLDRTFSGKVLTITPASASALQPPPASSATADFTKVTQLVPVRISLDYAGYRILPGTSAEVDIQTG